MKAKTFTAIAAVIAIAALIYGYTQLSGEKVADTQADEPIASAAKMESTNGATRVSLDARTQQLIGLKTAALPAATLAPEIEAYGRVLDSAALISLENDVISAEAAFQASRPEYERLKKLSAENNTSAFALQSAEARMEHDRGALETARAQLMAASCKALMEEPSDFFERLAEQQIVLVRLDLPVGDTITNTPAAAQLTLPGFTAAVPAEFLGRAASTDPQSPGRGFLFSATNATALLTPGLPVAGTLRVSGQSLNGVIVPEDAVVRANERAWIYVQTDETNFERRELILNRPTGGGWFVTNSIAPGDKVVVIGAQTLLSEEDRSQIKLED